MHHSASQSLQAGLDTVVTLALLNETGETEEVRYQLAPAAAGNLDEGFLGEQTPLAKAIRAKRAGDVIAYSLGDIVEVRIISVEPADRRADPDAAARRQAVLDEARRKAEQTNAEMFAASYGSKWGGYEADSDT